MLRKESDKVVFFLHTCLTFYRRWWWGRPLMDFKVNYKILEGKWWHHPFGHFRGRATGFGGSPRLSQPQIQPTHQRPSWLHDTVVEHWSLAGELYLSCARPAADGWPLLWVNCPPLGQLCHSSFRVDKWIISWHQMCATVYYVHV